jgi:hypothetical protein
MLQKVNETISVITVFDKDKKTNIPYKIRWNNQVYKISKLAYYHQIRDGQKIQHIYHVTDGRIDFRLRLDSQNLNWFLEEVSDGLVN